DRLERVLAVVEEVDDRRRARAQHLDAAEQRAHVDLVGRLRRRREHRVREEHPRLERQVVPQPPEPVLVRVRVRVDHPRHDGVARAVDRDAARRRRLGDGVDAAAVNDDVGAGELPRADVDKPVPKDDQLSVGSIAVAGIAPMPEGIPEAMSIGSVPWISSSPTVFAKPSWLRTGPSARATATSATYATPAIAHASSGTGPHEFGAFASSQPFGQLAVPVTPKNTAMSSDAVAGQLINPACSHDGTFTSGRVIWNMRGSRKWSTAMITVADGTVTARKLATLNQPSMKWKFTRSAAITPPPATSTQV